MDILNSIKAHLYERSTSPLAGAFVLSWLVWNYRLVMVFLSDLKLDEKFEYISMLYPDVWTCFWSHAFFYPFLTALAVVLFYPLPAVPLFWYSRFVQMIQRKLRQKIEKEKVLSVEESQDIILENIKIKDEFSTQIKRKDEEIAALKAENEALNSELNRSGGLEEELDENFTKPMYPEDSDTYYVLPEAEQKILRYLSSTDPEGRSKIDILSKIASQGESKEDAAYHLGNLEEKHYVKTSRVRNRGGVLEMQYFITQSGRSKNQEYKSDV